MGRASQLLAGIEQQLAAALARSADELRSRGAASSVGSLNAKFALESSFELSVGSLEVFYGGLDRLVGPPRMLHGSLLLAMESEHTKARVTPCPPS